MTDNNNKNNSNKYRYGITPEASHLPYDILAILNNLSGIPSCMTRETPIDELLTLSNGIVRRTVLSWTDNELAVAWAYLRPVIPMLRRLQELVEDERQRREANAELLSQ